MATTPYSGRLSVEELRRPWAGLAIETRAPKMVGDILVDFRVAGQIAKDPKPPQRQAVLRQPLGVARHAPDSDWTSCGTSRSSTTLRCYVGRNAVATSEVLYQAVAP